MKASRMKRYGFAVMVHNHGAFLSSDTRNSPFQKGKSVTPPCKGGWGDFQRGTESIAQSLWEMNHPDLLIKKGQEKGID